MQESLEVRVARLEMALNAQVQLNAILFPLVIRHDEQLMARIAETLRQLLVSPAVELPPLLEQQIRTLRDGLVSPIPQEVVEVSRQPSIRPVE